MEEIKVSDVFKSSGRSAGELKWKETVYFRGLGKTDHPSADIPPSRRHVIEVSLRNCCPREGIVYGYRNLNLLFTTLYGIL